ncbi:MAG: CoA transferase [Acidimicrobiia bacterium]|nr:CoA transferase [Acidimicrobiia bacterium]
MNSISLYYAQQNTGKRNVSIDLHRAEGVDLALRLADQADVVLENSRPGVMDRLGLGYESVSSRNPRVVYASITGYGQTGPWSGRRAYAVLVHAEAGLDEAGARLRRDAGDPDATPVQDGTSHADVYAGLHAASAILASLFAREHTGLGQHIDVAMAEALLHTNDFAHWDLVGTDTDDRWAALAPAYSPIVRTGAGPSITIAGDPVAPGLFERYVAALGRPDLADDPRFAPERRRLHRRELLHLIEEWTLTFDDFERLEAVLDSHGLPIGRLRTVAELLDTDWARERGVVAHVPDRGDGVIPVPQAPWRFSSLPVGVRGEPAYRGEHNHEVLGELLGLTDAELYALDDEGIISQRMPRGR